MRRTPLPARPPAGSTPDGDPGSASDSSGGTTALVLVGMSVREVEAGARIDAMAREAGATVAHLQVGEPSLARELTRLADAGVDRVELVGVCLGTLSPAVSWLRRVAAYWSSQREGGLPEVAVATTLLRYDGELPAVLERGLRELTGREAPLTSDAWEEVPGHRHHVLVCRGPRCSAQGSDRTAEALARTLMDRRLGDDDVLVTQTACLFPCNHAPVVCVQPDDVWYGPVDESRVQEVVDEHLVAGRPVAEGRLPRSRRDAEVSPRTSG